LLAVGFIDWLDVARGSTLDVAPRDSGIIEAWPLFDMEPELWRKREPEQRAA
jgi:hypothetical protein